MTYKKLSPYATSLLLTLTGFCAAFAQDTLPYQLARAGQVFKVFQFPQHQMPRFDGQVEDWAIVPDSYRYGTDLLMDTEDGLGTDIDPDDLKVEVVFAWVKGLNRLYFLYEAYDDFWDFGDGQTSKEQHPIYQFKEKGVHKVITLTVDGPAGTSKRTRYWEVMIR